jgi:hypothetical protein
MIRTKDELIKAVSEFIGENDADEAIAILEDVTDTLEDFEKRADGDGEDWKKKYEDNDKSWREKYRSRFVKSTTDEDFIEDEDEDEEEIKTYEELFEEVKI